MPSTITKQDFFQRVFTTSAQVQFSQVDPYGHMNSSCYAQIIADHRAIILDECAKIPSISLIQKEGMAWVYEDLHIKFLRPCFYAEKLEVSSWIDKMSEMSADVCLALLSQQSRKVRAIAKITIRCIDVRTGKPRLHPESLTADTDENLVQKLPLRDEWLAKNDIPATCREWLMG